jgi:hypothetical protein
MSFPEPVRIIPSLKCIPQISRSKSPMRVGMVTIRVRQLDPVADFYRDVIGLTATSAQLDSGGVRLLALEANPEASNESRNAAGLFHTAFLMPTRKKVLPGIISLPNCCGGVRVGAWAGPPPLAKRRPLIARLRMARRGYVNVRPNRTTATTLGVRTTAATKLAR